MISYEKLWAVMSKVNPETGKRHRLNELFDDPKNPDKHAPINITKPTIDRMRRGEACSLETIDKLCAHLQVQPGDILEWLPGEQPFYARPEGKK